MVVVAVAGGTGHLGQTIIEVLRDNPKHKVIVLARKVRLKINTTIILSLSTVTDSMRRHPKNQTCRFPCM